MYCAGYLDSLIERIRVDSYISYSSCSFCYQSTLRRPIINVYWGRPIIQLSRMMYWCIKILLFNMKKYTPQTLME